MITEATKKVFKGTVTPAEENVVVYVITGEDTVSSTYASVGFSEFLATGVPEGVYAVSLGPGDESAYDGAIMENINVIVDDVTDVGWTELTLK